MRRSFPLFAGLFLTSSSLLAQTAASAAQANHAGGNAQMDAQILRVENGLLPPVLIKGEPVAAHTLASSMQANHVPAVSVAVMHHGVLLWAKGYGTTRDGGPPVDTDTLFQAASISKSVTATAVLRLVEQGKLSLDAPIQTELKSWTLPAGKQSSEHPVTMRELLSHTAGTNVHGFPGYASTDAVPTLVQVLDGAKPANTPAIRVENTPSDAFSYSGGGFTIVQQALIDSTGKPFPTLLHDLVLAPAGMTHSSFQQPLPPASLANAALPVDDHGKAIPGGPHTYPELAAAGLWTTPTDLVNWMGDILASHNGASGHVLSPASTATLLTPIKDDYALGVGTMAPGGAHCLFSHTGGNAGYGAVYVAFANGDGAAIMTDGDNGYDVYLELLRSLAAVYGWPGLAPVERTVIPLDSTAVTPYLGHFKTRNGPPFTVSLEGGHLFLDLGGRKAEFRPSDGHTFFTTVDPSAPQFRFDSKDGGTVLFSGGQTDTFTRQP